MDGVVFERHDRSAQSTAGGDLVPGFELFQHALPFLLAALLGIEHVENQKHQRQKQHHATQCSSASGLQHQG
jgi:hypothetical protein